MNAIKCPSCGLVNASDLTSCRRCNAPIDAAMNGTRQYGGPYADVSTTPGDSGQFRFVAVLVGWVVDVVGSLLVGLGVGIVFGIAFARSGMKPQEMVEALSHSPVILGVSLAIGLVFTVLGGFVGAHLGRSAPVTHALGVGILSTATGLLSALLSQKGMPLFSVLSFVLTIPAAVLGGVVRRAFGGNR